ncbi:MAG: YhjD/YihY/BrkB family envelope integrity protein [Acidimicrobiales bacterium]
MAFSVLAFSVFLLCGSLSQRFSLACAEATVAGPLLASLALGARPTRSPPRGFGYPADGEREHQPTSGPPVIDITAIVASMDRLQRRVRPLAFGFGVIKKYGDDRGGQLAALLAYYGFLSFFPLILLLVTILGLVVGSSSSLSNDVKSSALSQFPVVGADLGKSITALHRNGVVGIVVGFLGLVWGSQGASQIGQFAMAQIWNVPGVARPNFWTRLARTYILIGTLGILVLVGAGLAAVASWGQHSPLLRAGGEI